MANNLFWRREREGVVEVGLTDDAFALFGQLWAIIPTNERKRNYTTGDAIVSIEGSDSLGNITMDFPVRKITFNGTALERPDEMNTNSPLFFAEAT